MRALHESKAIVLYLVCWMAFTASAVVPNVRAETEISQPPAPPWESPLAREAPYTGEIRDIRSGGSLTPDALIERLATVDLVLLGERHDNPDHHRLQTWIAERLFAQGRPYALAFEMIDGDQSVPLAEWLATTPRDAAGLGAAIGWDESGWPDWSLYQPIATAAVSRHLPILAANLPPSLVRAIAINGMSALPQARAESLQLMPDKDTAILAAHTQEIQDVHCGMLPDRALAPFALAQYARDAEMARVMADQWQKTQGKSGVLLIAGAGHVRSDRGVPFHLARRAPQAKVLSLAFVEARDDQPQMDSAALPYDLVWLTARVDDGDHCAEMRQSVSPAR